MRDPIIAEVRRARRELSLMDPAELEKRLEVIRERYKDQIVKFPPKRVPRVPLRKPRSGKGAAQKESLAEFLARWRF